MYKCKAEVDKHVENLQSKLSSKEFKLRTYSIARLYYDVGCYESCRRYVEEYLKIKDNSAAGHKLLGQALQKLGQKDMAIAQYHTSINIDPSQTNLILNICELLLDDELELDIGRARYWCELAEQNFPHYQVTYRLRERLLTMENPDTGALIDLLKSEISVRSKDVNLHKRLLNQYLKMNELQKAFEHAIDLEFSKVNPFQNSFIWYESLSEVLSRLQNFKHNSWEFQLLKLTTAEKLCNLSLSEVPNGPSKSMAEATTFLHNYDQEILQVALSGSSDGNHEFHTALINHHRGQLCFMLGTYLMKKAKKELIKWREAIQCSYPLLLTAYYFEPVNIKMKWINEAPAKQKIALHRWHIENCYRGSQTGYCILSASQEKSQKYFLDQISQFCADKQWKGTIYEKLFNSSYFVAKKNSSFLLRDDKIFPNLRIPKIKDVQKLDIEAQELYPNSLHHIVWIVLNYDNLANFKCNLYSTLKTFTRNYTSCGPETLNSLDMDAFLYCAVKTAQYHIQNDNLCKSPAQPSVLPANITYLLCSAQQMKWWDCAIKLCQNQFGQDLTDVRLTISRGIEVVRCVDNHGLDVSLLCILGRTFNIRSKNYTNVDEKNSLQGRSNLYYSAAILVLEKIKNNISYYLPEKRMFDYTQNLNAKELHSLLDESKLFVGIYYMNENKYQQAIEILVQVNAPVASFHLGQIYQKLAENETSASHENMTPEKKTKHLALLNKAKEWAYITLDKLQNNVDEINNTLLVETQALIEQLDVELAKLDVEITNHFHTKDEEKYSSDENASSNESPYYLQNNTVTNHSLFPNLSSTPVQRQRSLVSNLNTKGSETSNLDKHYFNNNNTNFFKIETQIRSLKNAFYEQSKDMADEIQSKLADQIINIISTKIQDTKDELKIFFEENISQVKCENQCDIVSLKKEVAELKKKLRSTTIVDENDEILDPASGFSNPSQNSAYNVFSNCNQRLMHQGSLPTAYQIYGPGFYSMYNQLPPPPIPPIFDPTRPPLNYSGVYPDPSIYQELLNSIPPTNVHPPPQVPPVIPPIPSVPVSIKTPTAVTTKSPTPIVPANAAKPTSSSFVTSKDTNKTLPVNVVITSSDPLPPMTSKISQPVLSVKIPPEHIKNAPHNYQIQMPSNTKTAPTSFGPEIFSKSTTKPFNILNPETNSLMANNQPFQTASPVVKLNSSTVSWGTPNTSLNKSRTMSEQSNTSVESYDPCPDFKPIVPLPDEVKLTTGEENEDIIFRARAKLYRFVDKEWKERGLGEMKILKHKETGKARVLMRREQIHKICANHIITPEMEIKPMQNETKAYFWFANDSADETTVFEKFCIRFKTADLGKEFFEIFEKARQDAKLTSTKKSTLNTNENSKINDKPLEIAGFGDKFKPSSDSWNCETCYLNNKADVAKCIACNNSNPNKPNINATGDKRDIQKEFVLPKFGMPPAKQVESKSDEKPNPFSSLNFKTPTSGSFSNIFNNILPSNTTPSLEISKSVAIKPDLVEMNSETANISDTVEEFVPTAEFTPVVPLPALVDQKTGEENEDVLFEHRSKLLRFDLNTKEWKERGLGNMKLLVQKNDKEKLRLLMRREGVMKVCCNHAVTKDIKFEKMAKIDKAVTWCAKDFSEGDLTNEVFCLRFKTVKLADDFLEAVTSAQKNLSGKDEKVNEKIKDTTITSTGWGDSFKPKPGSWECPACLVRNESNIDYCSACETPKDPSMPKKEVTSNNSHIGKFNFGIPNEASKTTFPNTASITPQKPFSFGIPQGKSPFALSTSKSDDIKPSFGIPTVNTTDSLFSLLKSKREDAAQVLHSSKNEEQKSIGDMNKKWESKTIFGNSAEHSSSLTKDNETSIEDSKSQNNDSQLESKPINSEVIVTPVKSFSFLAKEGSKFEFNMKSTPTTKASPAKSENGGDEDDSYVSEDENRHIHFAPVIPLPDMVEVTTGEENEDILYSHRAKLFRYCDKEWKERGVGDIKILKNKESGSLRVLMRRDQIHKICLNHVLNSDVIYKPKDNKNWLFSASDFSEGKVEMMLFCVGFVNSDVAAEFKKAIDNALADYKSPRKEPPKESDDEIQFVNEVKASSEDIEKARELMLPDNFFNFKLKNECPGCRGCNDDEDSESNKTSCEEVKINPMTATEAEKAAESNKTTESVIAAETKNVADSKKINETAKSAEPEENKPFRLISTFSAVTSTPTPSSPATSIFSSPVSQTPFGSSNSRFSTPFQTPSDKTIFDSTPTVNIFKQADNSVTFSRQGNLFATPKLGSTFSGSGDNNKNEKQAGQTIETTDPVNKTLFATNLPKAANIFSEKLSYGNNEAQKSDGSDSNPLSLSTSIFADSASTYSKPVFEQPKSLFGGGSVFGSGTIFSGNANQTQPLFGAKIETKSGGSLFNTNPQQPLFGSGATTPIFGANLPEGSSKNIFQSFNTANANSSFVFSSATANIADKNEKNDSSTDNNGTYDSKSETLLFSSLAPKEAGFAKKDNFSWEGAGQKIFGGFEKRTDGNEAENDSEVKADEEYDPHYDPIVPLPDKIEVRTGEEDEEKLFGARAKLFRFDDTAKEWKERGVGELKILHHPEKNTFRLLLRREQVHKAVLNMLLNRDFELLPMKNSDKAWTWASMNYAENPSGVMETLCVRFKDTQLKDSFKNKVEECVRKLQGIAAREVAAAKGETFGLNTSSSPQQQSQNNSQQSTPFEFKIQQQPLELVPSNDNGEENEKGDGEEGEDDYNNEYYEGDYDDEYYYDENEDYEDNEEYNDDEQEAQ